MFRCRFLPVALSAAIAISPHANAQVKEATKNPAVVSIVVDTNAAGTERVPDSLFGSFLEPIGNSINQGLSAEALVNPSLEEGLWSYTNLTKLVAEEPELAKSSTDTGLPLPWQPMNPAAGRRYELHHGDAANSWQSVEIMGFVGQPVGIMQKVYLPVQRTLGYRTSLYVRHLAGSSKVTIMLRKHGTDVVLARTSVDARQPGWTKYEAVLTLKREDVQPLVPVDYAIAVEPDERIDVDELSLQPDDAVEGLDPDAVAMSKAMNSTIVRLGGNFSSEYHWREGVGPQDKRISEQNVAWGIPEYNVFGTDEFLAFCKLVHATPQIDINLGSGTPEEAADWVRYIRAHYTGKVIYELGNELYGNWQTGHVTANEIGLLTLAFSNAVRAVAPDAEIIATGGMPQHFEEWNAAQLKNPPGTYDLLSTHFIRVTNNVELPNASPDFMASAAYALPVELGRDFHKMQAQLDAMPAMREKVHFAMDEWLFNSRGRGERVFTNQAPSSKNEGGGLMVAGVFNTLFRNSRIVPVSEITGLMEFAGIWKEQEQVYATPSYYVFRLYSTAKGEAILPVKTDSGSYDVRGGVEGFTNMANIPYIDVVATMSLDHKRLTLFCINRDIGQDIPVSLNLGSFKTTAKAEVQQLKAATRFESNDATHPRNVVPLASTLEVPGDGHVSYTLPRESVTMIRFDAR